MDRNLISSTLKSLRKEHKLTQVDLALKSGVGLNFVRELEQGKATVRMDKVAQVFDLFDYELVPQKKMK
ncbi:MAG: helix-turn-helix transcriptional regulator [Bacteroidales bacterium]|nr:helix-turn-helix transcriptional regulator [Bacteroidales bacterium]